MPVEIVATIPSSLQSNDHPYLNGAWQPLFEEVDATDLEVIGRIPEDIDGIYLRNTENQIHQPIGRYHPFEGDGMLHMLAIKQGKARYRNRFVKTEAFFAEQSAGKALWAGLMEPAHKSLRPGVGPQGHLKDASSTDVVVHAGRVLSTFYQCGKGYQLDPHTLENLGCAPWVPEAGVSAHCKVDLATGELLFFNYGKDAPYLHYGVVNAQQELVHYTAIPLPGMRSPHDMAFSKNFAIFNDFPMFPDAELQAQGRYVVRFHKEMRSRFAIVPRRGTADDVRWFEAEPTYVLHFLNAYEDGDEVIVDGYFQEDPMPRQGSSACAQVAPGYQHMMAFLDQHAFRPRLHRWHFNLKTGNTREYDLDQRVLEFGTINQSYCGKPYRYVYSAIPTPGWFLFSGLLKHDLQGGGSQEVLFGEGRFGSESPFVPRLGSTSEDDGYLISFITDLNEKRSECVLFDAKHLAAGPICRIILPHQICSGTHAYWADGASLGAASE